MKLILHIFLFCSLPTASLAQAFTCDGDFILSLTEGIAPSKFYRIGLDPLLGTVTFNPLPAANAGTVINAMGYRITDNYIYGVHPEEYGLYRIDATGMATFLADVGLDENHIYYAGAITPDGQFLVLLGNHKAGLPWNRLFVKINLDDYSLWSTVIPNVSELFGCTDIAFDPTSGILYGFDGQERSLVTINENTGFIDRSAYPQTGVAESMGALFFDAFGNLYGYGTKPNATLSDTFFKIDTQTGAVSMEAIGPETRGKDGCACSYNIELTKTVYPEIVIPCTEVTYVFEIVNASNSTQTGIEFLDEMPPELTITEILYNPYVGTIISGMGTNVLSISNLEIPRGVDSIVVRAEVAQGAEGIYKNQAALKNLPASLGEETISDNPKTLSVDDSTELEVIPFSADLHSDTIGMCENDEVILDTSIYSDLNFTWDNGSSDPLRTITEEGQYWFSITSLCETLFDTIVVIENTLDIELGPDIQINLGDSVLLQPEVFSYGNVSYEWTDPQENSLSCHQCREPFARPAFDLTYTLQAIDEFGCVAVDEVMVRINKDRQLYIPNVFSPNFDGTNDLFYFRGNSGGNILVFRVFDRWGATIFEKRNGILNDPSFGWDGTFKGKELNNGVYVWYAEMEYFDGEKEILSGDITIFK